jgi:hypothetical protein
LILSAFVSLKKESGDVLKSLFLNPLPFTSPSRPSHFFPNLAIKGKFLVTWADKFIALTVAGIVVNSVSITLSALTSLDWQSKSTHERQFAQQLIRVTHVHDGGQVVVTADQKLAR